MTKKLDFPGEGRNEAIGFAVKGKRYLGGGEGMKRVSATRFVGIALKDFWQYSPDTDKWIKVKDYSGKGEYRMVASAMSGKAFVGTGWVWLPFSFPKDFCHITLSNNRDDPSFHIINDGWPSFAVHGCL